MMLPGILILLILIGFVAIGTIGACMGHNIMWALIGVYVCGPILVLWAYLLRRLYHD